MKLPMNRKMIGSENGASACSAGATPRKMARSGPNIAVTAIGSASESQSTITSAMIAAIVWAWGLRFPIGISHRPKNTTGARSVPIVRRRRLNCSSAGE